MDIYLPAAVDWVEVAGMGEGKGMATLTYALSREREPTHYLCVDNLSLDLGRTRNAQSCNSTALVNQILF